MEWVFTIHTVSKVISSPFHGNSKCVLQSAIGKMLYIKYKYLPAISNFPQTKFLETQLCGLEYKCTLCSRGPAKHHTHQDSACHHAPQTADSQLLLAGKQQACFPRAGSAALPDRQPAHSKCSPGSMPGLGWGSEAQPHVGSDCIPEREQMAGAYSTTWGPKATAAGDNELQGLRTPAVSGWACGGE